MRTEKSNRKVNQSTMITVEEIGNYKIQETQGVYFQPGEYMLWNLHTMDFERNTHGDCIIFANKNEVYGYLEKENEMLFEDR